MTAPDPRFVGLSCYTGSLASYLTAEFAGTAQRLVDSIRLAIRTDLPDGRLAFSHHRAPLNRLADGTRLWPFATPDRGDAVEGIGAELATHGRCLVVTDNAALPWSPSYRSDAHAPHWLLVDQRRDDRWHVVDVFSGLLPTGEQLPHHGWLDTAALLDAMTEPPGQWSPEQRSRNELAFGFPVPQPGPGLAWLRREPAGWLGDLTLPGRWLTDDARTLPFIVEYLTEHGTDAQRHLDDLWTAARHRAFRHRWMASAEPHLDRRDRLTDAASAWDRLPGALRFAVESARRGRPRASLVRSTLADLARHEHELPTGSTDRGRSA